MFSDIQSEKSLLSGILRYNFEIFSDVAPVVNEASFTDDVNRKIFTIIEHLFEHDEGITLDAPVMIAAANDIGYPNFFKNEFVQEHLKSLFETYIEKENVFKFASKIKKIQIAKELYFRHDIAKQKLLNINGSEKVNDILSMSEINILDIVDSDNSGPKLISEGLKDRITHLCNNPIEQVGISSGFPVWDTALGGGLRGGTVNIIGARTGVGKSIICANITNHIAGKLNIPVLYMDTELRKDEQEDRLLALKSEVDVNLIATGQISKTPFLASKVFSAIEKIQSLPYYHESIAGLNVDAQFSIIKQWILKHVGLNPDTGHANKCVIVYDYIKLMDTEDLKSIQEFQALGFFLSDLHNLSMKYDIPIVSTIQLNRDGITKETGDVVSGSDRILWLCSNFSIFKEKSDEEISQDGLENGNRKLVVMKTRHGPGLSHNNYINMYMDGSICKIQEGKTKFELNSEK